jgi:hypothetical protein
MEAINQGTCTECGESNDNYTVADEDYDDHEDYGDMIVYALRCACGETANLAITEEGLRAGGTISHADASWNTEDDSDE